MARNNTTKPDVAVAPSGYQAAGLPVDAVPVATSEITRDKDRAPDAPPQSDVGPAQTPETPMPPPVDEVALLLDHEPTRSELTRERAVIHESDVVVIEEAEPEPVIVHAVPTDVYVTPRLTQNCRIGGEWYSFNAGTRTKVSSDIVDHLKRAGVI